MQSIGYLRTPQILVLIKTKNVFTKNVFFSTCSVLTFGIIYHLDHIKQIMNVFIRAIVKI